MKVLATEESWFSVPSLLLGQHDLPVNSLAVGISHKPWTFPYHYQLSLRNFLGIFATSILSYSILFS